MVSHAGGAGLSSIMLYFQTYGVFDVLLPFILVFTIVYAIMRKTQILGDKKNFDVIIALVLGLLFVVPHIMGTYPIGYDPVHIVNESLPSIGLVAVAAIMLLLLMGIFGAKFAAGAAPLIAIAAIIFVIYIFGASLRLWTGPYDVFYWWSPAVTELIIVILIFGVIVWFITREPGAETPGRGLLDAIKGLFEKD